MPEQRGRQHRRERVGEALKEEIGAILEGELGDPRIALCNVTEVQFASDGKSVRVYIHVEGNEQEAEQSLEGINAAKGYIRYQVKERMGVRHVPELAFILDRSEEYGSRIDQLLNRIRKRKNKPGK